MSPIATISGALGDPAELAPYLDPAVAFSRRNETRAALGPLLKTHSTSELVESFRDRGIWCAPVNDLEGMLADPAVRHLDPILEFDHPEAGAVRLLKHPVRYGAGEPELRHLPPAVGQHNREVLAELGYNAEEIAQLNG